MYSLVSRDFTDVLNNMFLPRTASQPRDFPEIHEDEAGYTINIDMPGIPPENVNISVEGQNLVVEGSSSEESTNGFRKRQYRKSWKLGDHIAVDAIAAKSQHGVLSLTLPKQEKAKPKLIPIST